jgi:hypothetical protein
VHFLVSTSGLLLARFDQLPHSRKQSRGTDTTILFCLHILLSMTFRIEGIDLWAQSPFLNDGLLHSGRANTLVSNRPIARLCEPVIGVIFRPSEDLRAIMTHFIYILNPTTEQMPPLSLLVVGGQFISLL